MLEILREDARDIGGVVGGDPIGELALIVRALPNTMRRKLLEEPGAGLRGNVGIHGHESGGFGEETESVGGERNVWTAMAPVGEAAAGFAIAEKAGVGEIEEMLG